MPKTNYLYSMKKKILYTVIIAFVCIQFYRPAKNINTQAQPNHIANVYPTSTEVNRILKKACNDCHSNNTVYPWYANIQPVSMWLTNHVNEGKEEINFDDFGTYTVRRQYKKMKEIIKQVKEEKEMPLASYTWIHKDAILTDAEINTLASWAKGMQDSMKSIYPIDSLERKKKAD